MKVPSRAAGAALLCSSYRALSLASALRMGVGKESWTASLFGTNLTNEHAALTIDNTVFAWQQPRRSQDTRPANCVP